MTETEFAMLCLGIQIGALLMLLANMVFGILDDRRDRKAARDAMDRLEAARKRVEA